MAVPKARGKVPRHSAALPSSKGGQLSQGEKVRIPLNLRKYHLEIVLKKLNYYFAEVAGEYEMNFFVHFMQETNLLEFEKFYKGNPPEKKKGIVQNLLGTGAKYFSKAAGFLQIQNDTKVKKRVQDPFDL